MIGWRIAAASLMLPASLAAQTVRGTIADERDAPVAGVILQLLNDRDSVVARGLSNEQGEFRLTAANGGTYAVRTQRIGFRPARHGPFDLRSGADRVERITLTGLPVTLGTVSVVGGNPCRSLGDSTAATFLVWEQARAALTATALGAGPRSGRTMMLVHERQIDPGTREILEERASVRAGVGGQPWYSLSPDSLHRAGYVATGLDGSTYYYAPGLDVLLSDIFLEDHCVRITPSSDSARIGIDFEPTPARRRIPELRGTLWLDRKTSELRSLEFRYANIPRMLAEHAGGTMTFARTRDATWIISGWTIRMPALEQRSTGGRIGRAGASEMEIRVASIKVNGGDVLVMHRGSDTVWARPPVTLSGILLDSASSRPVVGARVVISGREPVISDAEGKFTIPHVRPGAVTLDVRTPALDAVGAVHRVPVTFIDGQTAVRIRVPPARQVAPPPA